MRRNSFWTFVFSLIPGAGQMYLGLMKKGVFLMLIFCILFALSTFLQLTFLAVLLPVIWFYAFFDSMNARRWTDQQVYYANAEFDKWLSGLLSRDVKGTIGKRHAWIGWGCVVLGVVTLLQMVIYPIWEGYFHMEPWIWGIFNKLPTLLICLAIILLGVYLVKGKKAPKEEDLVEFRGERHD